MVKGKNKENDFLKRRILSIQSMFLERPHWRRSLMS